MPAVTNQSTLIPSCSQRSEQKCTVVSFPAGQIVPCVHGLLCRYSVTYSKPSVSDTSVSGDDVNSVRVEQGSCRALVIGARRSHWYRGSEQHRLSLLAHLLSGAASPCVAGSLSCTSPTLLSSLFACINHSVLDVSQWVGSIWGWLWLALWLAILHSFSM